MIRRTLGDEKTPPMLTLIIGVVAHTEITRRGKVIVAPSIAYLSASGGGGDLSVSEIDM
jgi:hypothetical protein